MASWHSNTFAYPLNVENSDCSNNEDVLPLPVHSFPLVPPHLCIPPPMVPPPPLHYQNVPPPICNLSLPPPPLPPPSVTGFFPPPSASTDPITDADSKFETFKVTLETKCNNIKKERKFSVYPKVSEIKLKFVNCFKLIEQLESITNCLQITQKSLSEDEWLCCCKEADQLKEDLSNLSGKLTDTNEISVIKKVIDLRRKKRRYKKKKLKEWQDRKREAKFSSEQENRRIDLWLEKMKDQVSRAKREEDIKREADLVLADVTAKKAEAKRMLNMLNLLSKLRTARTNNLSTGKTVSEHETKAFTQVIERLKKMWMDQFNGYKVEEEGLKVMLGHAEEERASIEAGLLRKNLKAWHQGIFGSSQSNQQLPIEELIQIRHDWDKFICTEDTPMASSIPVGWILPSEPASEEWGNFLNSN